jgi:hypothetical protein
MARQWFQIKPLLSEKTSTASVRQANNDSKDIKFSINKVKQRCRQ